jgi:4-amino-4-deoxy-L-arabinose transferase-like glycosyltransferase
MKVLERRERSRWDVSVEGVLLLGLVAVYAAAAVAVGRATPMWFDELITMLAAHEPTWRQMFLAERADGNPPLVFVLTRLSLGAFGANEFALRLPALCGMVTALVCCYRFVERRCGGASGLMAAAMLVCSGAAVYGYEGRPYGLVMGLTALLLVLWQRATERRRGEVGALFAVGVTTFCLVIAHPFGVLYGLVPVGVGEGVRWWRERRVDRGMIAALACGLSGLAITLPISWRNRRLLLGAAGHVPAVAYPGVAMLRAAKHLALGGLPWMILLPLIAVSVWCWRFGQGRRDETHETERVPVQEWAAVVALIAMVPGMWLLARCVTHYFFQRYTMVAGLGVSILVAMLCSRVPYRRWVLTVVALAMVGAHEVKAWGAARRLPAVVAEAADTSLLQDAPADEAIVIASPLEFTKVWWYSNAAMRMRIHILEDEPLAARMPDFIPEFYLAAQQRAGLLPFAMESLPGFLQSHNRFLLVSRKSEPYGGEWLPEQLRSMGYLLQVKAMEDGGKLELYEVTRERR